MVAPLALLALGGALTGGLARREAKANELEQLKRQQGREDVYNWFDRNTAALENPQPIDRPGPTQAAWGQIPQQQRLGSLYRSLDQAGHQDLALRHGLANMAPKERPAPLSTLGKQNHDVTQGYLTPEEVRTARAGPGNAGFTLSPGQTRFGPDGRLIATGGQQEQEKDLRELFDKDGLAKVYDVSAPRVQTRMESGELFLSNPVKPDKPTAGQEAIDRKFAEEYVAWKTGGFADVNKQLTQLDDALLTLESGKNVSGPGFALIPEVAENFVNADAVAVREQIYEVAQRNLRQILGGQFSEREGENLIKRAYNPNLEEGENAKRLKLLIQQIREAADAKQSASLFFEQNGTLEGWAGTLYNSGDQFIAEYERRLSSVDTLNTIPEGVDPALWEIMTDEEKAEWS